MGERHKREKGVGNAGVTIQEGFTVHVGRGEHRKIIIRSVEHLRYLDIVVTGRHGAVRGLRSGTFGFRRQRSVGVGRELVSHEFRTYSNSDTKN